MVGMALKLWITPQAIQRRRNDARGLSVGNMEFESPRLHILFH
jgi:hypothetical protein